MRACEATASFSRTCTASSAASMSTSLMAFAPLPDDASSGPPPMSEINTTPLVDVMLVLLVIFIITAPLFHQAVPIDLPRVDSSRVDDKPHVVQVALDAEGTI